MEEMSKLRKAIHAQHEATQEHPLAVLLMSGHIEKKIYADLVFNYLRCYEALEEEAEKAGIFEGLEGIKRSKLIEEEFESITDEFVEEGKEWSSEIVPSTLEYIEYVENIEDKSKLLAHVYIRYLSLMNGGQLMKNVVPSKGQMYDFNDIEGLSNKLRSKLTDDLLDESIKAFNQVIQLFVELAERYDVK